MPNRGEVSAQQPASTGASGSDRYPGSQPVEVKDASLPDIGVPVASEVYTTTDPVATVVEYYRQRYPDAETTEVNGQKIVAVNQPGAIKVIAVGTTGTETRIAIVQPAQITPSLEIHHDAWLLIRLAIMSLLHEPVQGNGAFGQLEHIAPRLLRIGNALDDDLLAGLEISFDFTATCRSPTTEARWRPRRYPWNLPSSAHGRFP